MLVVKYLLAVCLLILSASGSSKFANAKDIAAFHFQVGDPQRCPQSTVSIDVLPGWGWDNLANSEAGVVFQRNYSLCTMSLDRGFILPDGYYASPRHGSDIQTFTEYIEHLEKYTDTTAKTINLQASTLFPPFGKISGTYTSNNQEFRRKSVEEGTVVTRIQMRHAAYEISVDDDVPLHPTFRSRLLEIVSHLQADDVTAVRFLCQRLVRDYGTHYVTAVTAGATVVQEDHIRRDYFEDQNNANSGWSVGALAEASFGKTLSARLGGNYSSTVETSELDSYLSNRTSSKIYRIGEVDWLNPSFNQSRRKLAAIDRRGEPLHYVVTSSKLPDVPLTTLRDLHGHLESAVREYYLHNIHEGCMDTQSQYFDLQANLASLTCELNSANYTFGGVYQTCVGKDCKQLAEVNPKTGNYSCPTGYESILLLEGSKSSCRRVCERQYLFFKHCYDDCSIVEHQEDGSSIKTYWCSPIQGVHQEVGYLFGGVFTSMRSNSLTDVRDCPEHFYPLTIGYADTFICVSEETEMGKDTAVPFGGFFSCSSGNPLVFGKKDGLLSSKQGSLQSFIKNKHSSQWPKQCPNGYSQHLVNIVEGCSLMFCSVNPRRMVTLPPLRRPPYSAVPPTVNNGTLVVLTAKQTSLIKEHGSTTWLKSSSPTPLRISADESDDLHPGITAAITISITALIAAIVALIAFAIAHRRNKESRRALVDADFNKRYSARDETLS